MTHRHKTDCIAHQSEPRSERDLSTAAMEYMQNMREFLEGQRTSERRPSWLRRPDRRFGWERQHRRLLRPRIGTGVEQFLQENRGRDVVDFEQLHRVLTRLNPENTRLAMGIPFGGQDMAAETIRLHSEVLNLCLNARRTRQAHTLGHLQILWRVDAYTSCQTAEKARQTPTVSRVSIHRDLHWGNVLVSCLDVIGLEAH